MSSLAFTCIHTPHKWSLPLLVLTKQLYNSTSRQAAADPLSWLQRRSQGWTYGTVATPQLYACRPTGDCRTARTFAILLYVDNNQISDFCRPGDVVTLTQVRKVSLTAFTTSRCGYAITKRSPSKDILIELLLSWRHCSVSLTFKFTDFLCFFTASSHWRQLIKAVKARSVNGTN